MSLHSYSQMWLIPWSYTKSKVKDYEDLMYLAEKAVHALQKVHGTKYEVGSSPVLLYPTSGNTGILNYYLLMKLVDDTNFSLKIL